MNEIVWKSTTAVVMRLLVIINGPLANVQHAVSLSLLVFS